jgi:hypothetical protein
MATIEATRAACAAIRSEQTGTSAALCDCGGLCVPCRAAEARARRDAHVHIWESEAAELRALASKYAGTTVADGLLLSAAAAEAQAAWWRSGNS